MKMSTSESNLSCSLADAQRTEVTGLPCVKLTTEDPLGVGNQAPRCDDVPGRKEDGEGGSGDRPEEDGASSDCTFDEVGGEGDEGDGGSLSGNISDRSRYTICDSQTIHNPAHSMSDLSDQEPEPMNTRVPIGNKRLRSYSDGDEDEEAGSASPAKVGSRQRGSGKRGKGVPRGHHLGTYVGLAAAKRGMRNASEDEFTLMANITESGLKSVFAHGLESLTADHFTGPGKEKRRTALTQECIYVEESSSETNYRKNPVGQGGFKPKDLEAIMKHKGKNFITQADKEDSTKMDILNEAEEAIEAIFNSARISGNLKGSIHGKINCAAVTLARMVHAFRTMSRDEEIRRLNAQVDVQARQISQLKADIAALKTGYEDSNRTNNQLRTPPPPIVVGDPGAEHLVKALGAEMLVALQEDMDRKQKESMASIRNMLDAFKSGIDQRLGPEPRLRPSLAADKKRSAATAAVPAAAAAGNASYAATAAAAAAPAAPADDGAIAGPSWAPHVVPETKGKKKIIKDTRRTYPVASKRRVPAAPAASAPLAPVVPVAVHDSSLDAAAATPAKEWTEVVNKKKKRKKKKKKAPQSAPAKGSAPAAQKSVVKLVPPRSTAVTITLRPDAIANGATYASVMEKAIGAIKLQEFGLEAVRMRNTLVGGRKLEIPGASSGPKADAFAARLREVIADEAEIGRPYKKAEIRLVGLNDPVKPERVMEAIVAKTGLTQDKISLGEVKVGPWGSNSVLVRLPVAQAKLLADEGRLTVGWAHAQVVVMESLPVRCYRCYGVGHTSHLCDSKVDRNALCFRCSAPGHQASTCTVEKPHCVVCAEAKLPHDHSLGGRRCRPPATKPRMAPWSRAPPAPKGNVPMDTADTKTGPDVSTQ